MEHPVGLFFNPNFVTPEAAAWLLQQVDSSTWRGDLERRTQQYGYRYNYARSGSKIQTDVPSIESSLFAPFVEYMNPIFKQISGVDIQQMIVNEYLPKQKIGPHVDSPQFGPVVMTLTLGTSAPFVMKRDGQNFTLHPRNGDLLTLSGEARYKWTHETSSFREGRRVSLTFRSLR